MLNTTDITLICEGAHGDPFSILGPHRHSTGRTAVRAFIPGALQGRLLRLKIVGHAVEGAR